ncbi:ABC transporter permease [Streptomyces turgidiscabies]|uniref:ABC transporter, permease protein n=1 Tax=Streptomyces turgidiscabies (strain Car8) TaxID=698760 RepID=L7EUA1_STRT8|nr:MULTISPECIES: ABC transporter permease [Streptomyces]ELP62988.1 ABC transporter, permease protein [Streptomyces turgidiscabies Car8]MDX3499488.1 ABC transporter permease [Streptomyces turgidiscabies]GAQ76564.1 putative aliphatic sulfonates transport permease protein SsuC [Streptomyces turgidiscabies]
MTRAATADATGSAGPSARRLPERAVAPLRGLAGLAGLVAVIEVLPHTGLVSADYLPPASVTVRALWTLLAEQTFWTALGDTLTGWGLGLAISVVAGVAAGLVIGSVPVLRAITASTIEFLRPIPSVALIPVAVLLYGADLRSKLLLVVYAAFWQVIVQVLAGIQDVDPVADDTARSYQLGTWGRLRHVMWPTALPYVMTGVRLAATVALILAVTAELVIGAPGLGQEIAVAQTSGAVPQVYALVLVTGLLGVAVNLVARAVERRALHWHQSVRTEVA